jgi:hypothetical protein
MAQIALQKADIGYQVAQIDLAKAQTGLASAQVALQKAKTSGSSSSSTTQKNLTQNTYDTYFTYWAGKVQKKGTGGSTWWNPTTWGKEEIPPDNSAVIREVMDSDLSDTQKRQMLMDLEIYDEAMR